MRKKLPSFCCRPISSSKSKSYIVSALTSFTAARISLIGTSKPVSIEFEYEISAIIRIICKRSLQVVLHLNMTNMCRQRQKTLTHAQQSTYLLCMHTSLSRSYQIWWFLPVQFHLPSYFHWYSSASIFWTILEKIWIIWLDSMFSEQSFSNPMLCRMLYFVESNRDCQDIISDHKTWSG